MNTVGIFSVKLTFTPFSSLPLIPLFPIGKAYGVTIFEWT